MVAWLLNWLSAIPNWLSNLLTIPGIVALVLWFANLYRMRARLEPKAYFGDRRSGVLALDVINPSPMAEATVTRLFLALPNGKEYTLPQNLLWTHGLTLPQRLKGRDRTTFEIDLLPLGRELYKNGYRGDVLVTPKVEDGLGKIYRAEEGLVTAISPGPHYHSYLYGN